MSCLGYYSEPSAVFEGYEGPVVPSHLVYNGLGEPVGAIPLIAALAPLAAQLIGNLFSRSSATDGIDGFGEYDDGLGLYAGTELVPTQVVLNGFGEPVGAIPLIAALAPLAAKAAGFLAPLAAKAASAIVPLAAKAASAAGPLLQNVVAQALPALTSSLPGLLTSPAGGGAAPPMPVFAPEAAPMPPPAPPMMSPAMPMAPAMLPMGPAGLAPMRRRRRRRRRMVRLVRRAPRVMRAGPVEPMAPALPPPAPAPAMESSGGMAGYFGWPMGGLHACARCGGIHDLRGWY